jgi:peptidoglycan-associated lipoprotein
LFGDGIHYPRIDVQRILPKKGGRRRNGCSRAATGRQPAVEEKAEEPAPEGLPAYMRESIYFAFDKSILTAASQANLTQKAEWLRENPNATLTIEGHCDERGTNEYNLALGDRRAESAKAFLVDLGIEASRITTISYGEERPVCTDKNEECWAKNRRDQFIVN